MNRLKLKVDFETSGYLSCICHNAILWHKNKSSQDDGIGQKKSKPKRSALLWHNKLYFHEFTREVFVESSEDFSFATSEARRLADFSFLYFFIPWLTR